MINTNGISIAEDEDFVKELGQFVGGFEVYLQFDGFKESVYKSLRGENLLQKKLKAIETLSNYKIPTTLVTTVGKDINDDELGQIFNFALKQPYVRGVNFQPIAFFGRIDQKDVRDRITLSGILNRIEQQTSGMLKKSDFTNYKRGANKRLPSFN
jgi:uncharacterized radical SAM superfamily Fe-S cluster-containing enzyme